MGGNKTFPLKHLALKITRGEAAKIESPVREQGVGPMYFPCGMPYGHFSLLRLVHVLVGEDAAAPPESYGSIG